ncbi:ABC-2 type transport system ATP-binding protein [Paenibacillus sp. PastF-3]|uniref:ABC transporter ATP-binding protein n=1 Tax=unclassified Paenibacillus TaxID=185978 RepID=UPI000B9F9C18|nr:MULTISPECIES: ABC transporter ATP-binding protein [unclassified Paenibacillus]MDH6368613.1 ABC-2 type transport system ATP-binding protein [Paenibacillus sp. PastF-3]OZQ96888.1 ABC transporter [Paenibacillus sp. VTT E-133291]
MVLSVKDLSVRYGDKMAVQDLSFHLGVGEVIGLLGANGAGKSSSIAAILGIEKSEFQELVLLRKSPITERKEVFQKVGVQFQDTNFQDRLTLEEACIQWRALYKKPQAIDPLLHTFGLHEKKKQVVKSLSGGEKQRLAVLLALLPNPQLVFLDELTTGLDTKARKLLWKQLLAMKEKGLSIVLTSHYMDEVEALCDHLIILRDGKTVASGSVQEIIKLSGQVTLEDAYLYFSGEEEWE